MFMKGPFRQLLPVAEQAVRVRLPDRTKAREVKLLASNRKPRVTRSGSNLLVTISTILDHEILAIDLE